MAAKTKSVVPTLSPEEVIRKIIGQNKRKRGGPSSSDDGPLLSSGSTGGGTCVEDTVFLTLEDSLDKFVGEGAIMKVCKAENLLKRDKNTGEEELGSFVLDYFYNQLVKEDLKVAIFNMLHDRLGKKKSKPTPFEISEATLFNTKISISVDEEAFQKLLGWCKSERQMKFWKMLLFKWLEAANSLLKKEGHYRGQIRFESGFFKRIDYLWLDSLENRSDGEEEPTVAEGEEATE